jgi:glycosyltransferase involved in cell wall biosynthesis
MTSMFDLTGATDAPLRVLIVAEHASARFGGEAILPLHWFRKLRARGVEAWMIVHERTRTELAMLMPDQIDRVHFVSDTRLHKLMWHLGRIMPAQIAYLTTGYVSRLGCQISARRLARRLIAQNGITVVHQPIPVSPREPSCLHDLGAPVVMGPMNGGMRYPPGFEAPDGKIRMIRMLTAFGRRISDLVHVLMPGKLQAATLLVANERTRRGLPPSCRGKVVELVENAVDLTLWSNPGGAERESGLREPTRFVFVGRLVDWKAVDLLLLAFARVCARHPARLTIYGDGPMKVAWEDQSRRLGLTRIVRFAGWLSQRECSAALKEADVLVLPSLYECGGAVVLEAMACGLPVVATNWGGPADYIDPACGILVDPVDPNRFVDGLAQAMSRLARSPELRRTMGRAAVAKVSSGPFNWDDKVDTMLGVYRETVARAFRPGPNQSLQPGAAGLAQHG